jgi:hypothetical protein
MGWPDSDHCQNGRFFTPHAPQQPGFRAMLEWLTHREKTAWQKWISTPRGTPPPERLAVGELRVTFVNHATVLLQIGELNVITDPIWSDRASPVQFAGPRRHRAPGIRFEDLPPFVRLLSTAFPRSIFRRVACSIETERCGADGKSNMRTEAFSSPEIQVSVPIFLK